MRRRTILGTVGAVGLAGCLNLEEADGGENDTDDEEDDNGDDADEGQTDDTGNGADDADSDPDEEDETNDDDTDEESDEGRTEELDDERGNWRFQLLAESHTPPIEADGVVYAGSEDNHIYALDADSGELRWETELDDAIEGQPAVHEAQLLVALRDEIISLDLDAGDVNWSESVSGQVMPTTPIVSEDHIVAGSSTEGVFALSLSGDREWTYEIRESYPHEESGNLYEPCVGVEDDTV